MAAAARVLLVLAVLALAASHHAAEGTSNLVNILTNEGQFTILRRLLLDSQEMESVEGRTFVNQSAFVMLAPTDASFYSDFDQNTLACFKSGDRVKNLLAQIVRYFQITTIQTPIYSPGDLVTAAQDGKIWTVLGQPIIVEQIFQGGSSHIMLSNENVDDSVEVTNLRITEQAVTLIPLNGVLVSDAVRSQIYLTCFPSAPSSSPAMPSSSPIVVAPSF